MRLVDLCGIRMFSGIDTGTMENKNDFWGDAEECHYVKFTLDGTHYLAIENPEDGYRSSCNELEISDVPPKYSFVPCKVKCSMEPDDEYGANDILVVTDCATGEVVLRIGTGNCADYYPFFCMEYYPENLACNNVEVSDGDFADILNLPLDEARLC